MAPTQQVYLALGTNLGNRRANLETAITQLAPSVAVGARSSIYETEPAYVTNQPRFLNMVLRGHTTLAPRALLQFLKQLEQTLGRVPSERYGPRLIDLDILVYGEAVVDEPDLIIPHPRIAERPFVLVPFAELAPDLVLPGQQLRVAALAAAVQGQEKLVRVV